MLVAACAALLAASASRLDRAQATSAAPDAAPAAGRQELVERRTEHSRTFRTPDGVNQTTLSAAPLNYRDAAGSWQPIDSSLERQPDGSLENAAGDFKVTLPASAAEQLSVEHDGSTLGFTLLRADAASTAAADGSEATFEQVLPGVDAVYEAKARSLKETLLLASAQAPLRYDFALDAPGLTATVETSGDVTLTDAGGAERFRLAAPWMQDAAGALSRAAAYELASVDGQQRLTLTLDAAWLRDPARVFPVSVDPTVEGEPEGMCTLRSGASANTASCSANGPVWVGRSSGIVNRAVVELADSAAVIPDEALVLEGWVDYRVLSRSTTADSELEVYSLTRNIADGATWNRATPTTSWTTPGGDMRPMRESKRSLYTALVGNRVRQMIPRYLQQEVEGRQLANGILIKSTNESASHLDGIEDFVVHIAWNDRLGLGSQSSFEHLDLPGATSADVNAGNGNLVLGVGGPTLPGYRGRPLARRWWNSYAPSGGASYGTAEEGDFGSIALEEYPDHSSRLYGFTGVEGVFVQRPDGSFEPPAGVPAVMREALDGTYTLFFEDTNETWTFSRTDPHRLVRAEDAYGYAIDAVYDRDGDLTTLMGSDGRTLSYGYDGVHEEAATITETGGAVHRYGYDANDDLTSYTAPGGAVTRFTLDGDDRVSRIDWADGSQLLIAYRGDWSVDELTLKDPGAVPREWIGVDFGPSFSYADVERTTAPRRRHTFEPGLFARSLAATPTAVTTLALSGRLATSANTTLAAGTYPLTFTAGDAGGVARVDVAVDGRGERAWTWDCSVACARSQSATWNLNTADFPPGETVVRVTVTAAGGEQRAQAVRVVIPYSATVVSPRTRIQPAISGRAADGELLTAETSRWVGAHPFTFQPQWRRCNAAGAACQDLAGENDWAYTATAADIGSTLVVTVRARNARGVGTSTSAAFGPIVASPPVNVQLPEILGQPNTLLSSICTVDCPPEGTLTIDDGIWSGTGPVTLSYQWETCTSASPASCTAVPDATDASYEVPERYDGWMRVTVTAISPYGTATAASPVRQVAFVGVTERGDIGFVGTARVGSKLTANVPAPGTSWRPQWLRCNADGGDCRAIAGATATDYIITTEDFGQRLRLRVLWYGGVSMDDSGVSAVVRGSLLAPRRFAMVLDGEELWTATLDGRDARRIHAVSYADDLKDIAVSPDGDTVAMITSRGIELVAANGRGRRLLLDAPSAGGSGDGPQSPSSVAFAPSGGALVFGAYSPVDFATGIWSLDVATAAVARIDAGWTVDAPYTDRSLPAYSPRGDRIAYLATNGSTTAIVTSAANGGIETAVEVGAYVEEGTVTAEPRISEDGDEVIFSGRPPSDACGEAVFGIDVATQAVELRSWLRNCDVALTRPSWAGPGDTVVVTSSDDTSGGGTATRVETVDLATGGYDVLLHAGKPITALELPQTSVPAVLVSAANGETYTNGADAANVSVFAADRGTGVQLLGYGPSVASPTATWAADCDSLCPEEVGHEFAVATSGLPEGATERAVWAQNAAGTVGSTTVRLIVDRTRPVPFENPRVIESDAVAQTATLAWGTSWDPDLPGDVEGSGTVDQQFRWYSVATGWSSWADGSDGAIDLTSIPDHTAITFEARATDAVGNTATGSASVDWDPDPVDPAEEIDGIDWDFEDLGALRRPGVRCRGATGPDDEFATLPFPQIYQGEDRAGIAGLSFVDCFGTRRNAGSPRLRVELCVMKELILGAFVTHGCYSKDDLRGKITTAVITVCAPGTVTYRLQLRYWKMPVRSRDDPVTADGPEATYSCYDAGAWRGLARFAAGRADQTLRARMAAAEDDPPRNRDGGTTAGVDDNGFVLRAIIPLTDRRAEQAQRIAWRCGLLPTSAANGVWLRGSTLMQAGEGGLRRSSARFLRLSDAGQDRALASAANGLDYIQAVTKQLQTASDGGDCSDVAAELRAMKTDLSEGYVPGEGGPLDTLRQAALRHPPIVVLDSAERMRLIAVDAITSNVNDRAPLPDNRNRLCHGHPDSCPPAMIAVAGGDPALPGIPRLSLRFLRAGKYPDDTFVRASNYIEEAGDDDAAIRDGQRLYDDNPDWADTAYVRTWASNDIGWVQYWFFWYYDTVPGGFGFGKHEGDWEMVQVRYRRLAGGTWSEPLRATFASHRDKEVSCSWDRITAGRGPLGDEKFFTYAAAGTHASFPRRGVFDGEARAFDSARGNGDVVAPSLRYLNRRPSWLKWPGRWGGTPKEAFGGAYQPSPVGPAFQDGNRWKNPEAFDANARGCDDLVEQRRSAEAPFAIDAADFEDGVVTIDWHRDSTDGTPSILWTAKVAGRSLDAQERLDLGSATSGTFRLAWPHAVAPTDLLGTEIDADATLGRDVTSAIG